MEFVCPICNSNCKKLKSDGAAERYDCPNCGIYDITYALLSDINSRAEFEQNKHCLAKYLAETKEDRDHAISLTSTFIKKIASDPQYTSNNPSIPK